LGEANVLEEHITQIFRDKSISQTRKQKEAGSKQSLQMEMI
jgi:hypothetical protein